MTSTLLRIAHLTVRILIPGGFGSLLGRSYAPFMVDGQDAPVAGTLEVMASDPASPSGASPVASGFNDLGQSHLFFINGTYTVGISPCPGEPMRFMTFSPDFRRAVLHLHPGDRWSAFILDSMLRIFFAQIAVLESSFLIHSSAVVTERGAHLFMGRSGTGKSTHSSLWLRTFADCTLLNDDNPLVSLRPDGRAQVSGTPWSGKTPCWVNRTAPLLSMTRLRQAPANRYTPLSDVEAFVSALPGVSVIAHCAHLYDMACSTLGRVTQSAAVGILDCRPDQEAARMCRSNVETH